jgi:hypothetical protein
MNPTSVPPQTRRIFIRKLVASSLAMPALVVAGSDASRDPGRSADGFVLVNGWMLTDKDTRYQLDISMHDF